MPVQGSEPIAYSGIYPHLTFFNEEGECGTGAVVPWADRLWAVTYAPHRPRGSTDKLYEITPELERIVRPESIGGTPANRMIHRESQQLFIGPYAIDAKGGVRVLPYEQMVGRPTGNARHLTDPANFLYYATMEEGFYEVNVHSLEVTELYEDRHVSAGGRRAALPGVHGKGLYSGQGRLVYSNNGEPGKEAETNPFMTAGVLAEWDGTDWTVVRRAQFTEVTGPGGIYGNNSPEKDVLWSIGWDARSLLLMVLEEGEWHSFRLPKASHTYDGAHGWNTEWPRIREIGEKDLLMTMHGMFWRFPETFSASRSGGLAPRSTYLKIIGDFCRWGDRIVLGCDDTANREFLNTRRAKGAIAPAQSQSNLWFVEPGQLDTLGPVLGQGAVWLNDAVKGGVPSEPFLLNGFPKRAVHLVTDQPARLTLEIDPDGKGLWEELATLEVEGYQWYAFDSSLRAVWVRVTADRPLEAATAWFHLAGEDRRESEATPDKFKGLAGLAGRPVSGIIRAQGNDLRTLEMAALDATGRIGYYILDGEMNLVPGEEKGAWNLLQRAAVPSREGILDVDTASVIYTADDGQRFRLPKNDAYLEFGPAGPGRFCREVVTERDLFNSHGTFYELPAKNAGGFGRIRPVSTHNRMIQDYASYRGLLVLSGIDLAEAADNPQIIRSSDDKAALWVGALDDLWELGKPVGQGGPWKDTAVRAGVPSDPYLMTGFDEKMLTLASEGDTIVAVEVDLTGAGDWQPYKSFELKGKGLLEYRFPDAFQAYWVRCRSSRDTVATAQLQYR